MSLPTGQRPARAPKRGRPSSQESRKLLFRNSQWLFQVDTVGLSVEEIADAEGFHPRTVRAGVESIRSLIADRLAHAIPA